MIIYPSDLLVPGVFNIWREVGRKLLSLLGFPFLGYHHMTYEMIELLEQASVQHLVVL